MRELKNINELLITSPRTYCLMAVSKNVNNSKKVVPYTKTVVANVSMVVSNRLSFIFQATNDKLREVEDSRLWGEINCKKFLIYKKSVLDSLKNNT